jgi:hypothetical protein
LKVETRTQIEFGLRIPFSKERAAVRNKYQRKERKSNHKLEIVRGQELLVRVPLPMAEVWAEMQAQVEELTGQAGLQILRAILENEVTRRVGPPHRPNPTAGCVRWGKQSGYVVFGGQKIPLERPRVRTREGQEVELESYGQLQQNGKLQRAVRERMVAGLSMRNYRRAVESVLEGYGIEKSSVSRQFVAAGCNQLRVAVRTALRRSESGGADDRWHSLWRPGASGGSGDQTTPGENLASSYEPLTVYKRTNCRIILLYQYEWAELFNNQVSAVCSSIGRKGFWMAADRSGALVLSERRPRRCR